MIIYSVTVSVDANVKEEWLSYMRQKHIPDVIATGCFSGFRFTKVIGASEEKDNSYNVQYFCNSMREMHKYQVQFAPKLQKEHTDKYGEKATAFRTLLEDL